MGYVGSERMYHTFNFLPDDDEIISQLDRNIEEESSFLLKQSDKYQYSKSEADVRGDNSPPRYENAFAENFVELIPFTTAS